MFHVLKIARKSRGLMILSLSVLWLAACAPISLSGGSTGPRINTADPVPVALLVPGGSGQATDDLLARNLENAARLAISDLQGVKIDLRVYNTAGIPAQAASVAVDAVNDGAKIILGPFFAAEANEVGVAVASRGVNVLSFSNNTDIAGGNVFVLGPTFQNTAGRLVRYAASQGRNRIAVVYDQNLVGEVGRRSVEQAAANAGATIAGFASYPFSQEGIVAAVPALVSMIKSSGANAVIFTADTAGALPLVTQLVSESGVDPAVIRYMGLTRWDIPAGTTTLPGLQGGWFALPDPSLTRQFNGRYSAAYGEQPHGSAGLAYDGIAAIGALVKAGKADALTTSGLTQGSGFVGVNGIFRLRSDGTNERGLAIAQIQNGQIVIVDTAPNAFSGTGF